MANDEPRAGELTTANYGWTKPTVGASDDAWGGYLNADLDGIDETVHSVQTSVPAASTTAPAMDGTAAVGTGTTWARADHVHPTDTSRLLVCANRTALAAIDTTKFTSTFLTEVGREGLFVFKTGDYSSQITADVQQGVFVRATAIASTAGSWVRIVSGYLIPEWFGALKNGSNDDSVAINAALSMAATLPLPEVRLAGTYTITNSILPMTGVILRGSGVLARVNVNTNVAVLLSQAAAPLIQGGLEKIKFVNASASNASAIALSLDACQRCTFKDLEFWGYDAGWFASIMPTVVYTAGNAAIYGPDYQNFVFNVFENIMVAKCSVGMRFRGGGPTWNATVSNVITQNVYRNICLRQVTGNGIFVDYWCDNEHFYDLFINIVQDLASAIILSGNDPTAYRGVSAMHFFGTTIVRDATVSWTQMYGVSLHNASGCLFVGLGSDTKWEVAGDFFVNPIPVETYVLSSYMHFPSSIDTTANQQANRLAHITQNTMTRQSASVTVASSSTSTVVTFPVPLYIAPAAGKGAIQLTPYQDPGVRYWVDYTTITTTGFTIRYSAAVPVAFPMLWTAEIFAVA